MGASVLLLSGAVAVVAAALSGDPYGLPPGSVVERLVDGPADSVVAFYFEPLPSDLFCAVGLGEMVRDLRRVATFDAQGNRLWIGRVPPLLAILDAYAQPGGAVVMWVIPDARRGGIPGDAILMRVNAHGLDPSFQVLERSDLGGLGSTGQGVTSVAMAADGGFEVGGSFTSVRGQPRAGRARLRPDGSLDD